MSDLTKRLDDLEAWCRDVGRQIREPVDVDAVLAAVAAARESESAKAQAWDEGYSEGYSQARHGGGFGPVNPYSQPKGPTK